MSKNSAVTKKSSSGKGAKKGRAVKTLHVVPRAGRWVVRNEGSSRASSVHDTQREAVDAARNLARKEAVSLVVHGRDGRVKSRVSYRPGPPPPRTPREVLYPTSTPVTATREAIMRAVSEVVSEAAAREFDEIGGGDAAPEAPGAGESRRSSRNAARR
jgi:hypothetical protein